MTGQRVIPDYGELEQMVRSGLTPKQISEIYAAKGLDISPGTISVARHRKGWPAVTVNHSALIPWRVRLEHRGAYDQRMLRLESRQRAGKLPRPADAQLLKSWKKQLDSDDAVVHYEPTTAQGWFHVPRRHGIDDDLIRVPDPEDESVELRG